VVTKGGIDLNVCAYCHVSIDEFSRTIDHLHPKSRGGILSNKNKVPACSKCNKLKANMTVEEFNKAVESMIFLEQTEHRSKISYLKKIRANTEMLINKLNGRNNKKHIVRHPDDGVREDFKKKKKRP
jgi:hypothetical protein